MKKILALLLVLLMAASIALVACGKDTPQNNNDDDDDQYNNVQSTESESESESESETKDTTVPADSWVDKNDVVYAGADDLNLRTFAQVNSTNVAKQVDVGTKLNRVSTNGVWSKVTLDGESTEYFVSNEWISENGGDFAFVSCDPVALTVNNNDYNLTFYESPFESWGSEGLNYHNIVRGSGFKGEAIQAGYTLTKVGTSESGTWIKATFTGTIKISDNNQETFTDAVVYIKMRAVTEHKTITDPTYNPSSGNQVGGVG